MRDNSVRIGVLDEKAIATQATQATGQFVLHTKKYTQ